MTISELYEIKAFNARTPLFPPGILAPSHPHSLEGEHSSEQVKARTTVRAAQSTIHVSKTLDWNSPHSPLSEG